MAADGSDRVLLFGGAHEDELLHDTWTWDGKNWTQQSPANSPSGREAPSMANDGAKHVVLFGGMNESSRMLNETWTWDGKNWTRQSPVNSPGARQSAAMTGDGAGGVVLFGGYPGFGARDLDDTWTWDGTNWTEQHPASGPSARTVPALIYHAPGQVLLVGGEGQSVLNDTWVYEHGSANFGNVKLDSRATLTLAFNVHLPMTLAPNVKVLTDGQPNQDFTLNGTPSCAGDLKADSVCTVRVTFAPRSNGLRTGTVQLMDKAGMMLVETPVFGQGLGAGGSTLAAEAKAP